MICEKIISALEEKYPKKNAEEWDNIGIMVGSRRAEIKKILIALDADLETINYACKMGINLIITHHPFIFSPLKSIITDTVVGEKIQKLIKNDIMVYSMHTNIDSSRKGLNEYILEKLEVQKFSFLTEKKDCDSGIGRYYKLPVEKKLSEYIEIIKEKLHLEEVIVFSPNGNLQREVKKIAVVNGSGASFWRKAKFYGCDLLITGDIKYHEAVDALEEGMALIDIGHYESEKFFMELVEKQLKNLSFEGEIIKYCKSSIWRVI